MIKSESIVYHSTVLHCRDAEDGDTPAEVVVTQEVNGHVVWTRGYHGGDNPLGFWVKRDEAIEHGVELAKHFKAEPEEAKQL